MSERLKQRLVGAVVLISLAVIFLPIILDGSGHKKDGYVTNPIPDKPDLQIAPLEIPLTPVRPTSKPARVIEKPAQTKKTETKTASITAPKELPPPSSSEKRVIDAWVVQVGSFSNGSNAFALRDKLRKAKLHAFVEETKGKSGKKLYRVRVGPYKIKLEAEASQNSIKKNFKMTGKVMKHP